MLEAQSEARERVLSVAERLFTERGYTAVTLRDVAAELGMRQASLYYHVPGGKEELYVTVTERGLARHRAGLEEAIAQAGPDLEAQLRAAAIWLLSQPPLDWARMVRSDMPAIGEAQAQRLTQAAYQALLGPLAQAFVQAREREGVRVPQPDLMAGSFIALISSLHDVAQFSPLPREALADAMIDMLLNGIRPR